MRHVAKDWSVAELGELGGKLMVVTGANSGIGFHTALELGRAGATVVEAFRDAKRGAEAIGRMRADAPHAIFRLEQLDLADLASVRAFAERLLATGEPLDVLVNNAGVMACRRASSQSTGSSGSSAPTCSVTSRSPDYCCQL